MPLVVGETLRARLTRERGVAPPQTAALGADIVGALAYAHRVGIVHRDVKPENIFAVAERAVLADFGIVIYKCGGQQIAFVSACVAQRQKRILTNQKPISRALALDPNNARGLCALGNRYYVAAVVGVRNSRMRLTGQRERAELLDVDARTLGTAAAAIRRDVQRELHALLQQSEITDPFLLHVGRTVTDRIVAAYAELGEWSLAMDWVVRAYKRRPGRLRRMLADLPTDYLGLVVDPRYARLMRVAGMEDLM